MSDVDASLISKMDRPPRQSTCALVSQIANSLFLFATCVMVAVLLARDYQQNAENTATVFEFSDVCCPTVNFSSSVCSGALSPPNASAVRARDLGVPFAGTSPGPYNAITDIPFVTVGHSTLICGNGPLVVGQGPVRTGVTAILPRGVAGAPVVGAFFSMSGNGEATGAHYLNEVGCLIGPVLLTNTGSVGSVHQALFQYMTPLLQQNYSLYSPWWDELPIVAETWDGDLNDLYGLHVQLPHVQQAIEGAKAGPVAEGSVGGGTGMRTFDWKSGAGTSSRIVNVNDKNYVVAVYVQSNFGTREQMLVAGVPVGAVTNDTLLPIIYDDTDLRAGQNPSVKSKRSGAGGGRKDGSIVVVVGTDAPLSGVQVARLAKRSALGIARTGGTSHTTSGDLMIAFSTGGSCTTDDLSDSDENENTEFIPLDAFIDATVYATEEAIINSIVAAQNMTGINGNTIYALPHDLLVSILADYNRLE